MIAKVRGHVAYVQASIRRELPGRVFRPPAHRRPEARVPTLAFGAHGLGPRRLEAERVRKIAMSRRIGGIDVERTPEAGDRLVELAGILEHVAEVVVKRRVARVDRQAP